LFLSIYYDPLFIISIIVVSAGFLVTNTPGPRVYATWKLTGLEAIGLEANGLEANGAGAWKLTGLEANGAGSQRGWKLLGWKLTGLEPGS